MEGKKLWFTLLIWTVLNILSVSTSPEGGHGGSWIRSQQLIKRGEIQYCGLHLIEAVRNLCQGNYAALTRRSDPAIANFGPLYDDDVKSTGVLTTNDVQDFDSDIWDGSDNSVLDGTVDSAWSKNPKSLVFRILTEGPSGRRVRRSVTDECCKRSCRVSTMLKYCGSVSG